MARSRTRRPQANGTSDPQALAKAAGLVYVEPGALEIRRKRAGRGFYYVDGEGAKISDEAELARLKALVLPPGWRSVRICADPDGHLQATGRDYRGRKQYRYHERWRAARDETKFERMAAFAAVLPRLRERIDADLRKRGLPREKVLAAVVKLLETTLIRIGSAEYARENRTYGLTTMRDRHVTIKGERVTFAFTGKAGIKHRISLRDRQLARIVAQCRDLPGYEVFLYLDGDGQRRDVRAEDVNAYIREIAGEGWSAKDFRTWAATVRTAVGLRACGPQASASATKRQIAAVIRSVAEELGNTPAICRRCYVHPAVIARYERGELCGEEPERGAVAGLSADEAWTLRQIV